MEKPKRSILRHGPRRWRLRVVFLVLLALAVLVVVTTNQVLSERLTQATRNRAEVRLALYTGNITTELRRASVVPLLLSRDPALISALNSGDFSQSSARLLSYRDEIEVADLMLLDTDGRVVATTNRHQLGTNLRSASYFVNALRSNETVFTTVENETGAYTFDYSRRIGSGSDIAGVIVVSVDLLSFERSWAGFSDAVLITDSEGTIILSTESSWRGLREEQALDVSSVPNAIFRAIQATVDWTPRASEALLESGQLLRQEARIPFQGWRMTMFTTYASVRERVNAVLALEIMGFAILFAGLFYLATRRAMNRLSFFQRESAELRALNAALQREIAQRERAEQNLVVAEQTVAQTSKLAVLGEMSAAVSHELNQPLAAMKTYLAGAQLLLQRKRTGEALSSFNRIDDLINRMAAITKQLKSYARKGTEAAEPVDLRDCVSGALAIMEPQFKRVSIEITKTLPREPVMVVADRLRIEQVIINLLRNAMDATKDVKIPQIDLILSVGDTATLTIRDNGAGIEDINALFEPFYTTKAAGDGLGLGLAISSTIVSDFNGRLTARNGRDGGAVFDMRLPLLQANSVVAAQ